MKAAAVLATHANDLEFAGECNSAFTRAQKAIDALQWSSVLGGHYSAGNSGCSSAGCSAGGGTVFADAFYAQVLAYSLGLGELLEDQSRLDAHLKTVRNKNCIHTNITSGNNEPGCPNGLVIFTGRPVELTDLQVWEMATHDHAVLEIWRARNQKALNTTAVFGALALSEGPGTNYAQRINDQWATAGIKSNDGYPTITSHYGYHMTSWHLMFAMSGQQADISRSGGAPRVLTFKPALECSNAGYRLPVLLPSIVASVGCVAGVATLNVTAADGAGIILDRLELDGTAYPTTPITLATGTGLSWKV